MDKKIVNQILKEVETGYDLVADKFSETRKFFWRGMEFIGDDINQGDKILDYGCGNGRLLNLLSTKIKSSQYVGVDVSQKLIDIAKIKYPNYIFKKISGSQKLPYPDNNFNLVYSIAVFHHLPSEMLRKEIAEELYRVTKPGGRIIITVWNLWQRRYLKNIFQNYLNKLIYGGKLDWNDCYISFKNNKGEIFNRYHHAFTKRELKNLFNVAGFSIVKCELIDKRNILLIGKR